MEGVQQYPQPVIAGGEGGQSSWCVQQVLRADNRAMAAAGGHHVPQNVFRRFLSVATFVGPLLYSSSWCGSVPIMPLLITSFLDT